MHYPMVKDALHAGKNVLCEKPVTTSAEEAQELTGFGEENEIAELRCAQSALLPDGAADAAHAGGW